MDNNVARILPIAPLYNDPPAHARACWRFHVRCNQKPHGINLKAGNKGKVSLTAASPKHHQLQQERRARPAENLVFLVTRPDAPGNLKLKRNTIRLQLEDFELALFLPARTRRNA